MVMLQKIHGETIVRSKEIEYEHLLQPKEKRSNQIGYSVWQIIK